MSILNKLKTIKSNKAAQLFEHHPLAGESLEMRLQYLTGVALATAIDREPTETERQAFSGLANSLSVDAADAVEQLNERASVSEDDIVVVFDAIRQKSAAWIYLLDLAWLHAADGELDAGEIDAAEQLADLLAIHSDDVKTLHNFALILKLRKLADLLAQIPKLPKNPQFHSHLPELIKPCFPYASLLQCRWIDLGDGTVTDSSTNLMWSRYCIGRSWESGEVVGTETVFPKDVKLPEITAALQKINNNRQIGAHKDWRYPHHKDLLALFDVEDVQVQAVKGVVFILPWKYPIDSTESVFFLEKSKSNLQLIEIPDGASYFIYIMPTAAIFCRDWL